MTSLVFVTQLVDADDPVLGFAVRSVAALARRCKRLTVIANEVRRVPGDLGAQVVSLGKERGQGRASRAARFEREMVDLVRGAKPDALLAHMCPVYLNLAIPILKPTGVRLGLWFAHPAVSPTLRLAQAFSDVIFTSLPGAYPLRSRKVRVIGQAIDVDFFAFEPKSLPGPGLQLLAIGRTSLSKNYPTAVRALALVRERGVDARLRIVGPSTTQRELGHRMGLHRLVHALGLQEHVSLEDGVSPSEVVALIDQADLLVNTTVAGSGDKVVFEAMARGRPALASNPSFHDLLSDLPVELSFAEADQRQLATRIVAYAGLSVGTRLAVAVELRRRIETSHSLDGWADAVVGTLCR